jgi:bacteriocin biosynthesis cyclodehydratase domain-containing protein
MATSYHRLQLLFAPESERVAGARTRADPRLREIFDAFCSLSDGTRSSESIWGELVVAGFEPASIDRTVSLVEREGLIDEAADSPARVLGPEERTRYAAQMRLFGSMVRPNDDIAPLRGWEYEGAPQQVALKLATLLVVGGEIVATHLVEALALAGVGNLLFVDENSVANVTRDSSAVRATGAERRNPFVNVVAVEDSRDLSIAIGQTSLNLVIYCPDDFNETACDTLNELALSSSTPLLVYRTWAAEVELGPLVLPGDTACYTCYKLRRQAAGVPLERSLQDRSEGGRLNFALGVDWLAMDVVKFLTRIAEPVAYGRMLRLSFASPIPSVHPVLKLPRCPACGVHRNVPKRRLWDE